MANNPFLLKVSYSPGEMRSDETGLLLQISKLQELLEQIESLVRAIERLSDEDAEFAQRLLMPDILRNMEQITPALLPPSLRDGLALLNAVLQSSKPPIWEVRGVTSKIKHSIRRWQESPTQGYEPSLSTYRRYYLRRSRAAITLLSIFCVTISALVVGRSLFVSRNTIEEQAFGSLVIVLSILIVIYDLVFAG